MPATRKALALKNRNTMLHVSTLAKQEAVRVIGQGTGLAQNDFGGFIRQAIPGIVARYGQINAVTAADYYDTTRALFANASKPYKAVIPTIDAVAKSETLINYGMAAFMQQGPDVVPNLLAEALTLQVANYNRDTMTYNSEQDTVTKTIQRVAEPGACAFCAMLSFTTTNSAEGKLIGVRTFDYVPDYHSNCHCTVEVIYEGEGPIVPDYYADFAQEYDDAKGGSAQDVLARIRQNTGRA